MISLENSVNALVSACHKASTDSGWWDGLSLDNPLVAPTKYALMHSELSEALEGNRKGLPDPHLPHLGNEVVELADAMIRICDYAGEAGFDLGQALVEKMAYNAVRADHKKENREAPGGKKY